MKLVHLFLLLGLVGLAAPVIARADSGDADLDTANAAYQAGRYDESAKLFHQLIDARGYSAPLCFDLGNAEAEAGHLGHALLNYERGALSRPRRCRDRSQPATGPKAGRTRPEPVPLVAGGPPQHRLDGVAGPRARLPCAGADRADRHLPGPGQPRHLAGAAAFPNRLSRNFSSSAFRSFSSSVSSS